MRYQRINYTQTVPRSRRVNMSTLDWARGAGSTDHRLLLVPARRLRDSDRRAYNPTSHSIRFAAHGLQPLAAEARSTYGERHYVG